MSGCRPVGLNLKTQQLPIAAGPSPVDAAAATVVVLANARDGFGRRWAETGPDALPLLFAPDARLLLDVLGLREVE